jgi:ribosomal protein S18 acetylase RimI-like enzyme
MELVENKKEYWEFIRNLRNHKDVKTGFIQQENITPFQHRMHMMLNEEYYYICLIEGVPAGYVGVIDKDIRVATHPDFQGKGVGKFMINKLMEISPDAAAKVKTENEASIKLFEACGFKKKYYILEKE